MRKFVSAVVAAAAATAIGRGLTIYLGLDVVFSHWLGSVSDWIKPNASAVAWIAGGALGLVALTLFLSLEHWARELLSNSPPIGSIVLQNPVANMNIDQQVQRLNQCEMIAELRNRNSKLIEFDCELRATVNGVDLAEPVVFKGYIGPEHTSQLSLRVADAPLIVTNGSAPVVARMRYWPAPGSEDTELGVLMGPEGCHGETEVYARVQA